MSDLGEAIEQAIYALEYYRSGEDYHPTPASEAISSIQAALSAHPTAAPTEPAPGWCKHCQQYTIDEPLPAVKPDVPEISCGNMEPVALGVLVDKCIATYAAHGTSDYMIVDDGKARGELLSTLRASHPPRAPTVVEPVAWIYKPNRELLWPYEVEATNPIGIDEYLPLYAHPPRTALTVDQAIYALSSALAESKGWLRDYSDGVIRDAIDRREARTALREAARQALIALEIDAYGEPPRHERNVAINALRDALAGKAVTP